MAVATDALVEIDLDNLTPELNRLFNATADEVRGEYNDCVEELSRPHLHDIDWIVSSIASRNKYYSSLFERCCRLAFVQKLVARELLLKRVLVNDRALAGVLRRQVRMDRPDVSVVCTERVGKRIWRLLRPFRQYVIAWVQLTTRYLGRRAVDAERHAGREPIVLVDTFVLNNQAGDEGTITNGHYKDRYYPGLAEQLTDDERACVYYLPTIVGFTDARRAFRAIRGSTTQFLIHDDYLSLTDYLHALGHPFRILRRRLAHVTFRGVDLYPLLVQERWRNCSDFINLLGLLYYRFARRLAEHKVRVRLLVDWYENQVIDRGLIAGFHRFQPATRIVGYQGYIIATSAHIYTHPNSTEYAAGAVPDVVKVTGPGLVDEVREFCRDLRVEVAPGFRFRTLWRPRREWPDPGQPSVLIGLPIGLDDSQHILRIVGAAREQLAGSLRFVIKPHPTHSPERIKRLCPGEWPSMADFAIGDFGECVDQATMLLTNASSVSLEAVARGVPVIIVAPPTGLIQNPIPAGVGTHLSCVCHTAADVVAAIDRFTVRIQDRASEGDDVRRRYFAPVTREAVVKFLELNEA